MKTAEEFPEHLALVGSQYSKFFTDSIGNRRISRVVFLNFPIGALVKHVQIDDDYNRFYAEVEVTLTAYVEYAEIHLRDVDPSVHAGPLIDASNVGMD
jgi:hypothetical protein